MKQPPKLFQPHVGCFLYTLQPGTNPGMCPSQELNWRPFAVWDDAQQTESHSQKIIQIFKIHIFKLSPHIISVVIVHILFSKYDCIILH